MGVNPQRRAFESVFPPLSVFFSNETVHPPGIRGERLAVCLSPADWFAIRELPSRPQRLSYDVSVGSRCEFSVKTNCLSFPDCELHPSDPLVEVISRIDPIRPSLAFSIEQAPLFQIGDSLADLASGEA